MLWKEKKWCWWGKGQWGWGGGTGVGLDWTDFAVGVKDFYRADSHAARSSTSTDSREGRPESEEEQEKDKEGGWEGVDRDWEKNTDNRRKKLGPKASKVAKGEKWRSNTVNASLRVLNTTSHGPVGYSADLLRSALRIPAPKEWRKIFLQVQSMLLFCLSSMVRPEQMTRTQKVCWAL